MIVVIVVLFILLSHFCFFTDYKLYFFLFSYCAGQRIWQEKLSNWKNDVKNVDNDENILFWVMLWWIFLLSQFPHYYLQSRSWYRNMKRKTGNSLLSQQVNKSVLTAVLSIKLFCVLFLMKKENKSLIIIWRLYIFRWFQLLNKFLNLLN